MVPLKNLILKYIDMKNIIILKRKCVFRSVVETVWCMWIILKLDKSKQKNKMIYFHVLLLIVTDSWTAKNNTEFNKI
jgi:hypothetical protein